MEDNLKERLRRALPNINEVMEVLAFRYGGGKSVIDQILSSKPVKENRFEDARRIVAKQLLANNMDIINKCVNSNLSSITFLLNNIELPEGIEKERDPLDYYLNTKYSRNIRLFSDIIEDMKYLCKLMNKNKDCRNRFIVPFVLKRVYGKKYKEIRSKIGTKEDVVKQNVGGRIGTDGQSGDKYFALALLRRKENPDIEFENAYNYFKRKSRVYRTIEDFYKIIKSSNQINIEHSLFFNSELSEAFLRKLVFHGCKRLRSRVADINRFSGQTKERLTKLHKLAYRTGATLSLEGIRTSKSDVTPITTDTKLNTSQLRWIGESGVWGAEMVARYPTSTPELLKQITSNGLWETLPGPMPDDQSGDQVKARIQHIAHNHPNWSS